jgi:hypothetical protein
MLRNILWFLLLAFLLYFFLSSPDAATNAITSIAGAIGYVFQNVAAALDAMFGGGGGSGGAIIDPPRAPYDRPMGDIPKPLPPAEIPSGAQ